MADYLNIAGRVRTTASDGVAMEAQEVKDLNLNKSQQEINTDVQTELGDRYTKEETYSKEQVNDLITTPDVTHVSVVATDATTAVTDVLPATGEANTIYRVGNWNGTQYDTTMYALYAWNGSAYVCLAVRSFVGEVYDVSVNHPDGQGNPTPYADLAAALGIGGANIPADIRRGGMSIKFIQGTVQSSDNKYVQARCMAQNFTTDVTQWQGVDDDPTAGSNNLVKSGGVAASLDVLVNGSEEIIVNNLLPSGYTALIGITGVVGACAINTGIGCSDDLEIRCSFKDSGWTAYGSFFGAFSENSISTANGVRFKYGGYNNGKVIVCCNTKASSAADVSAFISAKKHSVVLKKSNVLVDDVSVNLNQTAGTEQSGNIIINGENTATPGTIGTRTITWYDFTILKSNVIVFDGIPCVRKSDSSVGMYDRVSGTFFGNLYDNEYAFTAETPVARKSISLRRNIDNKPTQNSNNFVTSGGIFAEIKKIEGGVLETYNYTSLSTSSNNWVVGSSAVKPTINLGVDVDYVYLNITGFGEYFTEFYLYETQFPSNWIKVRSTDTLPIKLSVTDGKLTNFAILIEPNRVTQEGSGKSVTATLDIEPIYHEERPSCENLIVKPSPFYTLPLVSGFSNFIPRIFIEGLMNDKLPKLRIDGNVTTPVSTGDDPLIGSKSEWINSPNNTVALPYVISHEGYDDYEMEVTRHRTSPYKLVGKTVLHMNIGSSNTDGSEHGETALEDFLCTELSGLWDIIKNDSSKIDVKFIGTKKENTTFTFNGKTFTTNKSCNEGCGGWAIADYLRHIFMVRGFGYSNSVLQAWWCSLGLRTKTRNGVPGRETPVDYSYSSADQSKAFEMRNTCHGYYDADPCEDLWNYIVDSYYLRNRSFTYNGVTYTFGQSYTGSQEDDDIQIAWVKFACTTGQFNPINANLRTDNSFYDYYTVQNSNGQYAFSLSAYLANYRTMDDSGERLSNDSPSKGARVSDVNDWDVCKPKSVKIEMGGNDYNLGVDADMTAADNKLMADLIYAYDSSIKIAIQEYRHYGALNPSFYSLASLSVRKGGYDAYRMLYHKAITELFESGAMTNYYHLPNFVSQTVLGKTKSVFDTLDDKEMLADYGSDYLHSTMFAYFDKAYQLVAWLCYINR